MHFLTVLTLMVACFKDSFARQITRHAAQNHRTPSDSFLKETSDTATKQFLANLPTNKEYNSSMCQSESPLKLPSPPFNHPFGLDLSGAIQCLSLSSRNINPSVISYPTDAEEHFLEIETLLARWKQKPEHVYHRAAGYGGPWIENHWIDHFESLIYGAQGVTEGQHKKKPIKCLREIFGPFIPILLPWTDRWVTNKYGLPPLLASSLLKVIRKDVLYITLSQNDIGLSDVFDHRQYPNILVLSAGGYGHVALPLLISEQPPLSLLDNKSQQQSKVKPEMSEKTTSSPDNAVIYKQPVGNRDILVSFTGSLGHSPARMRGHMKNLLAKFSNVCKDGYIEISSKPDLSSSCVFYQGPEWRQVMAASRVNLCPRGYGRTSYHISETVQMGLSPVHVWLDTPWVPYPDTIFPMLGYSTDMAGFADLMTRLSSPDSVDDLTKKESNALRFRDSHFSFGGVMKQIEMFLLNPSASISSNRGESNDKNYEILTSISSSEKVFGRSDLRCIELPQTPRAADYPEVTMPDM